MKSLTYLSTEKTPQGGIINEEMMVVNENWSITPMHGRSTKYKMTAEMEDVYYIYVVDDEEKRPTKLSCPLKKY